MSIFGGISGSGRGLEESLNKKLLGSCELLKTRYKKPYLCVLVKYHDCESYEGNKILVFENVTTEMLRNYMKTTWLDPHFLPYQLNLIARFRPNADGVCNAMRFIGVTDHDLPNKNYNSWLSDMY